MVQNTGSAAVEPLSPLIKLEHGNMAVTTNTKNMIVITYNQFANINSLV